MEAKIFSIFLVLIILYRSEVYGFEIVATSDRIPYLASLRFYHNDEHHCSGVIISRIYLLTAAHCVCNFIKHYMVYVIVGANSFIDEGEKYSIEKAICHEDYNFDYLQNDIALVKITKRMHFNDHVRSLPLANFKLPKKGIYTLPVWGYKEYFDVPPTNFKVIIATRIDTHKCSKYFKEKMVDDKKICTITKGMGACVGDSGGPVVYNEQLVGMISFGRSCIPGYPNVHVNISAYSTWIMDEIYFDLLEDD